MYSHLQQSRYKLTRDHRDGTQENHKCHEVKFNYKSSYPHNGDISSKGWNSCWVYGPYLFSLSTKGRPTRASNREINKKLLTVLWQLSCSTASHGELKNRVFPWDFVHQEPIRRHHLGSHDLHAGFLQSDVRAS